MEDPNQRSQSGEESFHVHPLATSSHGPFQRRIRINSPSRAMSFHSSKTQISAGNSPNKSQGAPANGNTATTNASTPTADNSDARMVVVRYFLDRPGAGLHNSAARFWFNPPALCSAKDILDFLELQGIALPGLLVEVKLDEIESFMLIEACEASSVEWDFMDTSHERPGILSIRLADLAQARSEEGISELEKHHIGEFSNGKEKPQSSLPHANTTSVGLFSFSMMAGLENIALMSKLLPRTVDASFVLIWGPYMFFVGGLMQVLVGILQTLRGNLYGATAFIVFGSFWFANGLAQILEQYFGGSPAPASQLVDNEDPWGTCLRNLFILLFAMTLLVQRRSP